MIDSHAHLGDDTLYFDIDTVLLRAQQAGVEKIINICTDLLSLERGLALATIYPWVYNVASTTPHEAATVGEDVFAIIASAAKEGQLIGIGETGLEYHYHKESAAQQRALLIRYLDLASETKLPVVIHCREAFEDFFEILDAHYRIGASWGKGVLHCFTGNSQEAEELIKRGWWISFSGIVTFKKSEALREIAKVIPLDQLLIETDAPYLTPQSRRAQRNEPAYLVEIAKVLADSRQMTLESLIHHTVNNTKHLFNI